MNRINVFFGIIVLLLFLGCQKETAQSEQLQEVIESYQEHKGYDKKEFPLGLFTKEHYQSEAEFAKSKLDALAGINANGLSETEQISLSS